jgi:hypothetical protein
MTIREGTLSVKYIFIISVFVASLASSVRAGATGSTTPETVMLELVGGPSGTVCPNGYGFIRNSAGGTSLGLFNVPAGNTFVITDVDWQYIAPNGASAAGQNQTLRLFATPKTGAAGNIGRRVLESNAILSSLGQGGANTSVTTGAEVVPRATLCVDVTPGPFLGGGGVQNVIIRGVLIGGVAK